MLELFTTTKGYVSFPLFWFPVYIGTVTIKIIESANSRSIYFQCVL